MEREQRHAPASEANRELRRLEIRYAIEKREKAIREEYRRSLVPGTARRGVASAAASMARMGDPTSIPRSTVL